MPKIIALRGMPGAGKSTYSAKLLQRNPNLRRINKDMLRDMSNQGLFSHRDEAALNATLYFMTEQFLRCGYDVISDNMNLSDIHMNAFVDIAYRLGDVTIDVIDMDTPLTECIKRDFERNRTVGVDIINQIHDTWMNDDGTFPELDMSSGYVKHFKYSELNDD